MEHLELNKKSKDDNENQGPSLRSELREERILARRVRVEQRNAQRRR